MPITSKDLSFYQFEQFVSKTLPRHFEIDLNIAQLEYYLM